MTKEEMYDSVSNLPVELQSRIISFISDIDLIWITREMNSKHISKEISELQVLNHSSFNENRSLLEEIILDDIIQNGYRAIGFEGTIGMKIFEGNNGMMKTTVIISPNESPGKTLATSTERHRAVNKGICMILIPQNERITFNCFRNPKIQYHPDCQKDINFLLYLAEITEKYSSFLMKTYFL